MNNESNNDIQNVSELHLLESLDLGISHRKVRREESKEDNFEDEMNSLLSKLNNQIDNIKKKINTKFQYKPLNLDLGMDNSSNSIKVFNEPNNKRSQNEIPLKNKKPSLISSSLNNEQKNNNNNNLINNNKSINSKIQIKEEESNKIISEKNNFIEDNEKNNEYKNENNNKNNNENDNKKSLINNNIDDIIELDIDNIPEIDDNNNENNKKSLNNKVDLLNTNINPNDNYKLDINEIDVSKSNFENSNLTEKKNEEKKESEEENKIRKEEDEQRLKKEKEEEEEKLRKEKEEEKLRKEKEEEEEKLRKEKEEEEKRLKQERLDQENKKEEIENNKSGDNPIIIDIDDIEEVDEIKVEGDMPAPQTPNISGIVSPLKNSKNNEEKTDSNNINKENQKKQSKINDIDKEKEESVNKVIESKAKDEEEQSKINNINKENEDKNNLEENKKNNILKRENKKNPKINSELRTNSMPENKNKNLKTSIKKEIKKSYTQKSNVQIKAYITKVEKDEESIPDISSCDDYPTLVDLVENEKALNEIIPDYKEKILDKENPKDIEAKQFFLGKRKYLKNNIEEGERLSQLMGELDLFHPDIMKNKYEKGGLKNIQKYEKNLEEEIFLENNLVDKINSPIGEVETRESFIQKYFLNNEKNGKILETSKKFFSEWRRILGDGNSFYRILMFSIFEAYILSNNLLELNYLLSDITSEDFIKIYKEKQINYKTCFSIFSIILNNLENKNISKAYDILLKSYLLKDNSFDKLLIVYLRSVIVTFIDKLKDYLRQQHQTTNINTYMIESFNIEPSFLIICSISYLFNVNMNIYSIKGELLNPESNQINLIDPEEPDLPLISFGFFFSSYYKLYPPNFQEKYNYHLNLGNINKQLTYIYKNLKKCKICEKETEHILFIEKKFVICKNCLEEHLSYACNFRADAFKEDGFIGLEYYTRPIYLCDNYYIDDLEIIELLESLNLINALCQKYIDEVCNVCKEKNEKLIKVNCGCLFCVKCLQEYMLKLSGELLYLNPLEKKNLRSKKCMCGNLFDIDEALKHIKYNENDMKASALRLENYINTLCLICTTELRKKDESDKQYYPNEEIPFRKIKLKKNMKNERANNLDYMEIEHYICENCYMKFFNKKQGRIEIEGDEEEEENDDELESGRYKREKYVDFENRTINCQICCRNHDLDNKLFEQGGCCTDCFIF